MQVYIKENSVIAKVAAYFLAQKSMAIVFRKTIYLHNASKESFLENKQWVRHELQHIYQYQHYGFLKFILKYLIEIIANGYKNNRFEVEAREKENDINALKNITFIS